MAGVTSPIPSTNGAAAVGAYAMTTHAIQVLLQQALSTFPGGLQSAPLLPPLPPGFQRPQPGVSGNAVRNPSGETLSAWDLIADRGKAIDRYAQGPLMTHSHNEFNLALDNKHGLDPSIKIHGLKSQTAVGEFQQIWNSMPQNQDPSRQLRTDGRIDFATLKAVTDYNDQKFNRPPYQKLAEMFT